MFDKVETAVKPTADPSGDLARHVLTFVPDADGDELTNRIALLKYRDWAAALRGATTSWLASQLSCEAHDLAGRMVFRHRETAKIAVSDFIARFDMRDARITGGQFYENTAWVPTRAELPAPRQAIVDLLGLLGNMDMGDVTGVGTTA